SPRWLASSGARASTSTPRHRKKQRASSAIQNRPSFSFRCETCAVTAVMCLFHGEDDKGNVVVEAAIAVPGDFRTDFFEQVGSAQCHPPCPQRAQSGDCVFFVRGIRRFRDSVRVENQAI